MVPDETVTAWNPFTSSPHRDRRTWLRTHGTRLSPSTCRIWSRHCRSDGYACKQPVLRSCNIAADDCAYALCHLPGCGIGCRQHQCAAQQFRKWCVLKKCYFDLSATLIISFRKTVLYLVGVPTSLTLAGSKERVAVLRLSEDIATLLKKSGSLSKL